MQYIVLKRGILSENLKNNDVLQLSYSSISFLKLRTRFLLTNVYKGCVGFFLFYLDLELFANI